MTLALFIGVGIPIFIGFSIWNEIRDPDETDLDHYF